MFSPPFVSQLLNFKQLHRLAKVESWQKHARNSHGRAGWHQSSITSLEVHKHSSVLSTFEEKA